MLLSVMPGVLSPLFLPYAIYQSLAEGTSSSGRTLLTDALALTPAGISKSIG